MPRDAGPYIHTLLLFAATCLCRRQKQVRTVFSPQKSRINLGSQPKKASAGKQGSLKQIVIVHDDHI